MEPKNIDLAKGTFVEHWPTWLRWMLFIPASLIAPLIYLIIQTITMTWFLDVGKDAFWWNLLRGMAWGGGTVITAAMVAPKKQRIIALIFLVIIAMIDGVALFYQIYHFVFNEFLEDVITLGAAIYVTHYIYQETDTKRSNL